MWLLHTGRAELKFFTSPRDVEGGYAILSHVWDTEETTFQHLQALRAECAMTGANPRDSNGVGRKIQESCCLAQRHGWEWIWIDTCCIDKTSSAELSEAINSMFQYYALSGVCYAFLRDVLSLDDAETSPKWKIRMSEFGKSRWHERGWTLQELVAPKFVMFVSSDWTVLGDKFTLAETLTHITRIPKAVLRLEQDLASVSIADRMTWASRRKTTRAEDEAYCLMGIFGVNMPTLYGEGSNAFYRLQEEIMKTSTDASLFAWGACRTLEKDYTFYFPNRSQPLDRYHYLLAPAPRYFGRMFGSVEFKEDSEGVFCITYGDHYKQDTGEVEPTGTPTFSMTPHGIRARLPVMRLPCKVSVIYLALLFCTRTGGGVPSNYLGLILVPSEENAGRQLQTFHCGSFTSRLDENRIIGVSPDMDGNFSWATVYISAKPPFRSDATFHTAEDALIRRALRFTTMKIDVPFRFSDRCLWTPHFRCHAIVPAVPGADWTGSSTLALLYTASVYQDARCMKFMVCLGVCEDSGEHWAHLHYSSPEDDPAVPIWTVGCDTHVCARDHIYSWNKAEKAYLPWVWEWMRQDRLGLCLKFTVCPMNHTGWTLVMAISESFFPRSSKSQDNADSNN